ncbi:MULTISPECIES: LysR family transcriptional regulator [Pseudomonas]|jgi:DNA-binding transcriptional LysR family regulator|uniref:LysR family transcriptional regulator n=2 Tax=Ectopseudomonas TaxID=3236654 RepID=A0A653AY96_ECTOL|nr:MULTISPECIES: LysR family transcriptional regulator [Pseudomonas]QTS84804.1 LysR family transcriptional regulator [Pseudomonas khazarica]TNF07009.1 MAG: LysR family transcriptional regulator [Pseudomonadales bacterium]WFC63117.1 LysR family transcriptional regulator [Pseudomonas sp. REST10]CAE6936914.1 LysR family transcriptional regulator [Pseudomonas oleovorans]|tara:strand:- start:530 stop:1444 length:915 start_codon:yes stop_codon:yes gene_type:complete
MDRHTLIRSFVLVADNGSFAAAALSEGVTPVVMGRRLDALERHLGVKLMHRSTRGLQLTDLGEQYLDRARSLLKDFDEADASVARGGKSVRGHLVVSAPAAFGRRHIAPHAAAFLLRYPDLKLSFNFTDSLVDLVRQGYDMGIRIGEVTDPNYVAVKLFPNRRVVCGAPGYFELHGVPRTLEDLARHNCLAFNLQGGQQRGWTFLREGRQVAVKVAGNLDCNDGELLYNWVKQGLGIGWRSTWEIQAELKAGELVTVLDDYEIPAYDIQAVYPQQRYLPAKVRFFIDYLKDIYNTPGYWENRAD